MLVDAPIDAGLVEVDADGNLKASQALVEIDPQAAELIDEGALVVSDEGAIVPTEKILAIDDTAREMFEAGYLKIDDNGLLVPAANIEEDGFSPLQRRLRSNKKPSAMSLWKSSIIPNRNC